MDQVWGSEMVKRAVRGLAVGASLLFSLLGASPLFAQSTTGAALGPCGLAIGKWASPKDACALINKNDDADAYQKYGEGVFITVEPRSIDFYESSCSIKAAKRHGSRCVLNLSCFSEGEKFTQRQIIDVRDESTFRLPGRAPSSKTKWDSNQYSHCGSLAGPDDVKLQPAGPKKSDSPSIASTELNRSNFEGRQTRQDPSYRADDISMDVYRKCEPVMDRGGMAGFRDCLYNERLKVASRIKDKQCSSSRCFYRLSVTSHVPNSATTPNDDLSAVKTYRGSGFIFVELGTDFKTASEEAPYGALLIDGDGRSTIVGLCTGSGCLDFKYVAGAHRGAIVYGPFGPGRDRLVRILEVPK